MTAHRSFSSLIARSSMNGRIFFWSLTSALAGFLFGFDTVVISGAEKTIQALWGLTPGVHGIAMASALYGTVVGSLLGGWPADRFGRKATLLWIGVLYFVGAVGSALAPNVEVFIAARVIGGLGIGISTVVAPMYISEIAPPKQRGRLAGMFQFNIVFGILIAFVSNALLAGIGEHAWRWSCRISVGDLCAVLPRAAGKSSLAAQSKRQSRSRSGCAGKDRAGSHQRRNFSRGRRDRGCGRDEQASAGHFGRSGFSARSCWRFSLRSSTNFPESTQFCISLRVFLS